MDVQDALLERRTVHQWRPGEVPSGVIDDALWAAHHAPNHKLTTPWRFTRIGRQARDALTEVAVDVKRQKGALSPATEARLRAEYHAPAALIVVSQVLDPDPHRAKEDYAAVACAVQNLMLSLRGNDVYSKWTTGRVTTHAETYRLCGIDPGSEEIVGFVWIGHALDVPLTPKRPPLDAVVREVP